jgi:predicted thioesterase
MPAYSIGMNATQVDLLTPADIGDEGLTVTKLHLACEMACHNVLVRYYGDDDASVGILNDIWFWGDAAAGELLHAEAMIAALDRKRVVFNVFVRAGTTEIARGVHERMLVSRAKFMASLPEPAE